jgi:hypothetical protein
MADILATKDCFLKLVEDYSIFDYLFKTNKSLNNNKTPLFNKYNDNEFEDSFEEKWK